MYLLIIIFKKSEFMAAQRARPILLNERFLVTQFREQQRMQFQHSQVPARESAACLCESRYAHRVIAINRART